MILSVKIDNLQSTLSMNVSILDWDLWTCSTSFILLTSCALVSTNTEEISSDQFEYENESKLWNTIRSVTSR